MAITFSGKDWKKIIISIFILAVAGFSGFTLNIALSFNGDINTLKKENAEIKNRVGYLSEKVAANTESNKKNTNEVTAIKIIFASQSQKLDNIEKGQKRAEKRLDDMYNVILQLKRTENIDYTPTSQKIAICIAD